MAPRFLTNLLVTFALAVSVVGGSSFAGVKRVAAGSNPGQFVNVQFLRELDTSGYIDRLYANP